MRRFLEYLNAIPKCNDFVIVLFAIIVSASTAWSDPISLPGNGSYAAYPEWTLSPNAQMTISFLTSEANGTILLVDTAAGIVHVSLEAGTLSVRAAGVQPLLLGEHLNDDAPHDLQITCSNDSCSLLFRLVDGNISAAAYLNCTHQPASYEPRSPLYVGGAPSDIAGNYTYLVPFAGCVDVTSTAAAAGGVALAQPFLSYGVSLGCRTPCDDRPCAHNAPCTYRWGAQAATTCDCRGVLMIGAGPYCGDDPATVSTLMFNGSSYHCYLLPPDMPYVMEPERSVVVLPPGHPPSGTIMTGVSPSPSSSFSLHLLDRRITFLLRGTDDSIIIRLSSLLPLLPSCEYQVEVTIGTFLVTMAITNTSSSGQTVDALTAPLPQGLTGVRFDSLCVGGGDLEVPIFVGSVQSPYHRQYALGEVHNFASLGHELVPRSTILNFLPLASDPPLTLHGPRPFGGMSFGFTTELPGPLLMASNTAYLLSILVATDQTMFVTIADNRYGNYTYFAPELSLTDGAWHTFDLRKGEEGGEDPLAWTVTVDNITCFSCPSDGCGPALDSLSSAPLLIGWKTQSFLGGTPLAFTGCMKDFRFQNGTSPNLEVMARRAAARFSTEGCPDQYVADVIPSYAPPTPYLPTTTTTTTSPLSLSQSPGHSPVHTNTSLTLNLDRKRLYAAIFVIFVIISCLLAVVCAVNLRRHHMIKRSYHVTKGKVLSTHSNQIENGLSPKPI